MSRMAMNIATARQRSGGRHKEPRPLPEKYITRTEGNRICPTCLKFGQSECKEHRQGVDRG